MSNMIDEAERNEDGDLIYEKAVPTATGTTTVDVNVTTLFTPGPRQTGNVEHLIIEAELAEEKGVDGTNPATPMNAEVAKEAIERMEKRDLTPAWRLVDEVSFP